MAITITYTVTPTKTASYTTAWGELVKVDPSAGVVSITLAACAGNDGRQTIIKNVTSSTISIVVDGNASETVDGSATYILNLGRQSITIVSDGTNAVVV